MKIFEGFPAFGFLVQGQSVVINKIDLKASYLPKEERINQGFPNFE